MKPVCGRILTGDNKPAKGGKIDRNIIGVQASLTLFEQLGTEYSCIGTAGGLGRRTENCCAL